MIVTLHGRVLEQLGNSIALEIGGVGVQVHLPTPFLQKVHPGEALFLHTHLVVREDSLNLYGFENREQRDLFVLLLGVEGIGPRLALAVLSSLEVETIRRAVFQQQVELFDRVPGIGRKTAQKILLHLQDRLPPIEGLEALPAISEVDAQVLDALTALGYSLVEAQSALQSLPKDAPQEVEERLRLALQYFT